MKNFYLFILFILCPFQQLFAQQITVKSTVTDELNAPLPGVSISITGTSKGVITDIDGNFSIEAEKENILRFSYLGYKTIERVASDIPSSIIMKEDMQEIDEVVVTALGIKREKKSLAYSVTELKDDAFKVKESNLAAGLAGKIAGVNVVKPTTGSMGSTRITIRGNGSFGSNQPLYVVDGVPIDNPTYGQPGVWGGVDGGDGISSLNSDDIESMSVLKGGAAAALYGSRAANGAIIITTKSGKSGKLSVELNSSYTFEKPIVLNDDFQYEYGQGLSGIAPTSMEMVKLSGPVSWGAKLDGSDVLQFDGETRPYIAHGRDNIKNFYNDAWALNNTLSLSGGSEHIQYRISIGDQRYDDLYPNSNLNRNNVSLNLTTHLTPRLTLQTSAMYMRERVKNRQNVNDYSGNGNVLLWTLPPNIDVRWLSPAITAEGKEMLLSDTYVFFSNPYFVAYHRHQEDSKDRVFGSAQLQYDISERLYLRGKAGGDMIYRRGESVTPKGAGFYPDGSISAYSSYSGEANLEAIAGYKSKFAETWALNAFIGWNSMIEWSESVSASGDRFIQPDFHVIGNTEETSGGKSRWENYINSVFAQTELSYGGMFYLTLSGRNDWFSALSLKNKTTPNNIFYPSVGAGFIISEALSMPDWIPYLKVRGSWAQAGGGIGPYNLALTYGYGVTINGHPTGSISSGTIPNLNLKPLTSITYEGGMDVRFFSNRLGIDATYYVRNTHDDIVSAQISSASGFNNVLINAGEISNKGIELQLSIVPVETKNCTWRSSFNFSYNKSEVIYITDQIDNFIVTQSRTGAAGDEGSPAFIYQEKGEPFGIIKGSSYVRDENGEIIYNNNGLPIKGDIKKLGEGVHPYTLGFSNNLTYKNIALNILFDGKFGGSMFSGTNDMAYFLGTHKGTLEGREEGVVGKGVKQDGTINDKVVPAMDYYMYLADNISEEFVYDASFIKLRELSLGYTFPASIASKLKMSQLSLSLIGRNLWTLYSNVPMVDPESGYSSGNAQGIEQWGLPATRSFGFNLNVKF